MKIIQKERRNLGTGCNENESNTIDVQNQNISDIINGYMLLCTYNKKRKKVHGIFKLNVQLPICSLFLEVTYISQLLYIIFMYFNVFFIEVKIP